MHKGVYVPIIYLFKKSTLPMELETSMTCHLHMVAAANNAKFLQPLEDATNSLWPFRVSLIIIAEVFHHSLIIGKAKCMCGGSYTTI